jgi:hypothetical protein
MLIEGKGAFMRKGGTDRVTNKDLDQRTYILVGFGLFVVAVALAVVLNALLPPQYRACVLMPGFCFPKKEEARSTPLEDIRKLQPGGPKFGLSNHLSKRY